jgi:glycosyltransferase involved in cell wall biosynthesis
MESPLVSILIPYKNTAAFLPECLESIQKQNYSNWEVLAVNDDSSDDSLKLVQSFAEKDSRIQVFQNQGSGIIEALRTGYSKSKGQFITRMDSDDIMTPNKIEVMTSSLLKSGRGYLAVGQVKYFSDRGISNGYERYEVWLNKLTAAGSNYSEIYKECVIPSPCWMTYREDLDSCDAFKPNHYPEDYDLTFRFYEQGLKCIPCNELLHHWRDYDTRTSRTSEHYAQNYFLDIKLYYFLKLEFDNKRPLIVWGAGNKGKTIAKNLIENQIEFHWLCDNPNKIGKSIYGQEMRHYEFLETLEEPQSIVTVANEEDQKLIRKYLSKFDYVSMRDYFFFC